VRINVAIFFLIGELLCFDFPIFALSKIVKVVIAENILLLRARSLCASCRRLPTHTDL
jgi:hypothetical protein